MQTAALPDTPDVVALADAVRPAVLRLSRRIRNEGQKSELTAQDTIVLGLIRKNPGIGVTGLADMEQTSRPTMSEHVKRLEARGLVTRDAHAEDGRRSGLALTPAGRRKLDQIRAERNNWLAKRLALLEPAERAQLAAAAAALNKLAGVD
jgi:DNA-binding MarR family transcriptional regulator